MLPENKSLYCSCLLMHCLWGAWFVLVARSRTISTKWILCQAARLAEIPTLSSNCFPLRSNLQYPNGLGPVKQMTWGLVFFFPLLTWRIMAYHDFPQNWLLSFSSSSKWAAGNYNEAALGLITTVLFWLSPFHPQALWKLGRLIETAKISFLTNCTKSSMPGSS